MRRSFRKSLQLLPVPIAQALLSSETALLVHLSVHQRETSVIRLASCNSRAEAKAGETEDSIRSQSTLYVSLPQSNRDLLDDRVDLGGSKVIDEHLLDLSR